MDRDLFEQLESNVRSYCRSFPVVFDRAKGATLWDERGVKYIDLFAGAGAVNYGHNPAKLKEGLIAYLERDGIAHGLDLMTKAKGAFMEKFHEVILEPRGMSYKFLFPGPAGTNAIEAGLKLARKATGRTTVAAFTNGFHGMSLGALAATGSAFKRAGAGVPLGEIQRLPFDGYFGSDIDTISLIEKLLSEPSSGVDAPAAFLVETIQGEGGLTAASTAWLRRLALLARRYGSLLIIDDIQAGCGRSGSFFSFDAAGIVPDIVCLSKSLSGYGLPLAMLLVRPEFDVFEPGEHNGTFRGFNHAYVTAREALSYWRDPDFLHGLKDRIDLLDAFLDRLVSWWVDGTLSVRGRGMMRGLVLPSGHLATEVSAEAFRRQVLIETSGGHGEVLKFLPPLNIEHNQLAEALERVEAAVTSVLRHASLTPAAAASAPAV
jgi:diaminobutyrate-2-oxoglutarate transaminase